jgi:hypothetical protein
VRARFLSIFTVLSPEPHIHKLDLVVDADKQLWRESEKRNRPNIQCFATEVRRSINVRFAVESTMATYLCSGRATTSYDCSGCMLAGENCMPMLRRVLSRMP